MNPIQIADKFYEARDTMKALWPQDWREKIAPFISAIHDCSRSFECDELTAVIKISKRLSDEGAASTVILCLAAAAEIMEPS